MKRLKRFIPPPQRARSLLYIVGVFLLTEGCFSTPFKSRKTTVFGTVTENHTKLPVDSIQIVISGLSGGIIANADELKTIYTDRNGKFEATIDVPSKYHGLNVGNRYFSKIDNIFKYDDYLVFLNNQRVNSCCKAPIGKTTQYDFVMLPK